MIDSIKRIVPKAIEKKVWEKYNVMDGDYFLTTFHRPSNVDEIDSINRVSTLLNELSNIKPVIFPIHPRTQQKFESFKIKLNDNIILIKPQSYLNFVSLMSKSRAVITDSGGVQEETTYLNVPCITFRKNTERPVTCDVGTNVIVGSDIDRTIKIVSQIKGKSKKSKKPKLWDGKSSHRIFKIIKNFMKP